MMTKASGEKMNLSGGGRRKLLPFFLFPSVVSGLDVGGFQSGPSPGSFYAGGMTYDSASNAVYVTGSHYNMNLHHHMMRGTLPVHSANCFVSKMGISHVKSRSSSNLNSPIDVLTAEWSSYGNPSVTETCSTIAAGDGGAFVVGSVEEGGWLHDGAEESPLLGITANLDANTLDLISAATSRSNSDRETHGTKLLYPVSIVHDDDDEDDASLGEDFHALYIAALTSTDARSNENPDGSDDSKEINWQERQKFGSSFYMTVYKVKSSKLGATPPELVWMVDFPIDSPASNDRASPPAVQAGGMILQKDSNGIRHLLVSGSTKGKGKGYGSVDWGSTDEDGFIMQLDPKDGSFLADGRHRSSSDSNSKVGGSIGANNLRVGTGSDDFVRGMCRRKTPGGDDAFYIVGGTKGDMTTSEHGSQNFDGNAGPQLGTAIRSQRGEVEWARDGSLMPFLRRISFERGLGPVWTTQWAAMPHSGQGGEANLPSSAYAMDCVVDETSNAVYVVGNVLKGAAMTQGGDRMVNQGGDDVWVAKVDETTGNVHWLTQLGSVENDSVAGHGSIAFDGKNVIIYGNTGGSLYRQREGKETVGGGGKSDIFIMALNGETGAVTNDELYLGGASIATGNYYDKYVDVDDDDDDDDDAVDDDDDDDEYVDVDDDNIVDDAVDDAVDDDDDDDEYVDVDLSADQDLKANSDVVESAAPKPPKNDSPEPLENESSAVPYSSALEKTKKNTTGIAFAIVLGLAAVAAALFFISSRHFQKKRADSRKYSIFGILRNFDAEDIDLCQSLTGGWHGNYKNKLAYGVNRADSGYRDHEVEDLEEYSPSSFEEARGYSDVVDTYIDQVDGVLKDGDII